MIYKKTCDGSVYKSHPLLSQDNQGLQIIAYYDNVEVCNPSKELGKDVTFLSPKLIHMYSTHSLICSIVNLETFLLIPLNNKMYSTARSYEIFCYRCI